MPTNYTGNPSATQAPAPTPAAGSPPILALPVDGDALDVASIYQAHKAAADFIAFLQSPFANGGAWSQDIMRFANARLAKKFGVDHAGLPGGHFLTWEESWVPGTPFNLGPGAGSNGRWSFQVDASGTSGTSPQTPGATSSNPWNNSKALVLAVDGSGSHRAEMRTEATACFTNDCYFSVDVDFALLSVLSVDWVIALSSQGESINGVNNGIYLIRPDTVGTNFLLRSNSGGTWSQVDSGILASPGVAHHLRLEWWGANVSDDSAAHAVITLDSFSTHIDTNLPNAAGLAAQVAFGGFITTAPITNPTIAVGPVKYAQYTP